MNNSLESGSNGLIGCCITLGVEGTYSLIGTHRGGPEDGDMSFSLTLQNISKLSSMCQTLGSQRSTKQSALTR
jgi:hypothetical protein